MGFQKNMTRATLLASLVASLSVATTLSAQVVSTPADSSAIRSSFLEEHVGANFFYEPDGLLSRVYGAAFSSGTNPVDSAERFLRSYAGVLNSDFNQLLAIGPNTEGLHVVPVGYDALEDSYTHTLVSYTQHVNGVPVFRGDVRCLVRNESGYPLVLVANALRDVRTFAANFRGGPVSPSQLDLRKASRAALAQFGPGAVISDQEQVIWAGYDNAPAKEPRLAYKFIVSGTGVFDRTASQRQLYIVDVETNKILFQEDQVCSADINVTVQGNATTGSAADACLPEAVVNLPYARITAGGVTYYTDVNGAVTVPNASGASVSVNSSMLTAGRYFIVNDSAATTESNLTQTSTGGALNFVHNAANTDESDRSEVNGYLQANRVRDYLLAYQPAFPTIAGQLNFPINVQVAGTCNAFYNGSSINFYPAGGGCNNTSFGPVIHHEYGHHIVAVAGSGQGEYGEGFGDVMGVLVTDESNLAVGFQVCTTGIRNANNTVTYIAGSCSSAGTEIHACGTLLSGCVWSTRANLLASDPSTYRSILSRLATGSVLLHAGTSITASITIDFLTLDDNDGNINNGTPHYNQINSGFTAHNLPGPTLQLLNFTFPSGTPSTVLPNGTSTFPVNVTGVTQTPVAGTGKLNYRVGTSGAWIPVPMTETAANQYVATVPATTCGSTVQFYVSASTTAGSTGTSPTTAPVSFYSAISASSVATPFVDTVETNLGWSLGTTGDTATTGVWVRGDPNGTTSGGLLGQPEDDVTAAPGVNCFFTGQAAVGAAAGTADVDGGFTSLISPTMDATGGDAYISYYRWYSNGAGALPNTNTFTVFISNNNGTTWTPLETVGPTGAETAGGWIFKELAVASFVSPTNQMKVKFVATDATGSLIEAAIDEVRMRVVQCAVPVLGDLNGDGHVDGSDLAMLLSNWNGIGVGDINRDGGVDGSDLAILLSNWG